MSVDFILKEKDLQELYKKCLEKWGISSQIMMLAEESSELTTATLHLLRTLKQDEAFDEFIEEIADVEIMLDEIYYSFRHKDLRHKVYGIKEVKIERLRNILSITEAGSVTSSSDSGKCYFSSDDIIREVN